MKKIIKQKYQTRKLIHIIPHGIFFWLRILGFCSLYLLASVTNVDFTNQGVLITTDELVYVIQFNIFQFYFVATSIINENIFGNYLCIVLMLHNAFLSIFIPATTTSVLSFGYWIILIIIAFTFLIEAIMSTYLIYRRRFESNLELFKKVGVNKKVNSAFATRKFLESFGSLNVFIASVISGKVFLLPVSTYSAYGSLIFAFTIVTYIQQLFITVKFNEESLTQRKIAIFLSFIRIPLAVGAVIWRSSVQITSNNYVKPKNMIIFLFTDVIIIAIFMIIVLIRDTRQFGSGLKEAFNFKTKRIRLS